MRTWWHSSLTIASTLLAHTASAKPAASPSPVGAAIPAEAGAAPASATRLTPPSPPTTWDEPPEPPAPPPRAAPPPEHWYGWQILVSDAASLTLAVATQQTWLAAPGYLVAPPLIHMFHGQNTRALASAGMRIGLPLLGYAIAVEGSQSCSSSDLSSCDVGMVVLGFIVGISAVGIDPALAYEPLEPSERHGSSFFPQILISDREARFGLMGSF